MATPDENPVNPGSPPAPPPTRAQVNPGANAAPPEPAPADAPADAPAEDDKGYHKLMWAGTVPVYQCNDCPFDSRVEQEARVHVAMHILPGDPR